MPWLAGCEAESAECGGIRLCLIGTKLALAPRADFDIAIMPPPDWMYTQHALVVTVPNMTSVDRIRAVMQDQGIGPLMHHRAVELGGMRPNGFRRVTVHFASGYCEGPSAERSEAIMTHLRAPGALLKVFPETGRQHWVVSLDRGAAGIRRAAALELVDADKTTTTLPELRFGGGGPEAAPAQPIAGADSATAGE